MGRLTGLFGLLALVLASVGLYGVMSYFVARRTSEVGIRMALGAARSSVVAMVMQSALSQILIGLGLGIPAALLAGHFMSSQLFEVLRSTRIGRRSRDARRLRGGCGLHSRASRCFH